MYALLSLRMEKDNAEASPYEPMWVGQERVGFITSAEYGHTCQRSLALAYLAPSVAAGEGELEVTVIGERRLCRVLTTPPVDPKGLRMRA